MGDKIRDERHGAFIVPGTAEDMDVKVSRCRRDDAAAVPDCLLLPKSARAHGWHPVQILLVPTTA